MKRILVPVDFSTHTYNSCQYALQLARASMAKIILFHSFFDQFYYSDGGLTTGFESGIMMNDEIILDFQKQKEKKLQQMADDLNYNLTGEEKIKTSISCFMETGNPEVQIINAIRQFNPDLIVMGSGGMGKKGLMAGSVARRIIDHASIPVVAVPASEGIPVLKNVAYMTTFDPDDVKVIYEIDKVLSPLRVDIFCLHLLKNETEDEAMRKMNNMANNKAIKYFKGRLSFHTARYYHNTEILENFITGYKIGLIAFIPHSRNIFENLFYQGITRDDLFKAQVPIMAVRPD